jgi:hypothetical protein
MSIAYGGIEFSEPVPLTEWRAPYRSGLFVVTVRDAVAQPRPYRAIYIGECGDFSDRRFPFRHPAYPCWLRLAGSDERIFISSVPWPNSGPEQRRAAELQLVRQYQPECNG